MCGSSREGRAEELSLRVEKLVDLRIGEKKDPKMKCCDGKNIPVGSKVLVVR